MTFFLFLFESNDLGWRLSPLRRRNRRIQFIPTQHPSRGFSASLCFYAIACAHSPIVVLSFYLRDTGLYLWKDHVLLSHCFELEGL